MKARRKRVSRAKAAPAITTAACVYPAESDPRQVKGWEIALEERRRAEPRQANGLEKALKRGVQYAEWPPRPHPPVPMPPEHVEILRRADRREGLRRDLCSGLDQQERYDLLAFMEANTTEALGREFGPWVRGEDGSWVRKGRP